MPPRRLVCADARSRRVVSALIVISLSMSVAVFGDEGEAAGPPPLEFSFSNPGARAMGLGGAFVALADDATAAFANPAGLVQMIEPEISIEARMSNFSTPYTVGGRYEGAPSGVGIDNVSGVRTADSNDTIHGIPFLSYVQSHDRWSFALYRHQLADFESHTATNGLFGGGSNCCQSRSWDVVEDTNLEIVSYGLAGAWRINDRLSVGLGVQFHQSTIEILTRSFRFEIGSVEGFFGPNPFSPDSEVSRVDLGTRDSDDIGFGMGVLWKGRQWRFGGVFRKGPDAVIEGRSIAGPANDFDVPPGTIIGEASLPIEFPDVLALGAAYQTADGRLTASVEWDRVAYSAILTSVGRSDEIDVSNLSLEDANEIHVGLEYVFLASSPLIAIRGGIWNDPNHRSVYVGEQSYERAILPDRGDHLHCTLGFGLAFRRVQFDIGVDLSEIVNTISVSAIRSY